MKEIIIGDRGKSKINDYPAFQHYKKNSKLRSEGTTDHHYQYKKIVNDFWRKVGDKLIENEGGVFLKGLGYFCIYKHQRKCFVRNHFTGEDYLNIETNSHLYSPTLFAFAKGKPLLQYWVMDRAFSRTIIKSKLSKALKSGKKYKNLVSTIYSLYYINKPF